MITIKHSRHMPAADLGVSCTIHGQTLVVHSMTVIDLFSKRAKARRGEIPDAYQYEHLPEALRVQIIHIMRDALGDPDVYSSKTLEYMKFIHDTLCREYDIFAQPEEAQFGNSSNISRVYNYFLKEEDLEKALDVIELGFRVIDIFCRGNEFTSSSRPKINPDDAIDELNSRMRYHGVGYQYESGELVKVDDQVVHQEAVKPALQALRGKEFRGPNEEFLKAFEHYRHGRHKEALNESLKSFESTMKVICSLNGWAFNTKDTASRLIDVLMANHLIPDYLQTHYTSLAAGLKSGIPTVRNRVGGHGQGGDPIAVPDHLVAYHLHLTASTILMLVTANKAVNRMP